MIERYELPARITANQNLLLLDIEPSWKADIVATLGAPSAAGLLASGQPYNCHGCCVAFVAFVGQLTWESAQVPIQHRV